MTNVGQMRVKWNLEYSGSVQAYYIWYSTDDLVFDITKDHFCYLGI